MREECGALIIDLQSLGANEDVLRRAESLRDNVSALVDAQFAPPERKILPEHMFSEFCDALDEHGITSGTIAELGGAKNSLMHRLTKFQVNFLSIFPSPDDPRFILADISNCPHVPDGSFDAIYSISVLEHVTRLHDAGREIVRLLKPGGITAHAVPFSYFFHGAPVDYWRLTTSGLEALFPELTTVKSYFYARNRRRNNLGTPAAPLERGGPEFAPDAFGGWRENWFVVYVGLKEPDGPERLFRKRVLQALIDILKGLTDQGLDESAAVERALGAMRHVSFNEYGRTVVSATPLPDQRPVPTAEELTHAWRTRGPRTVRPGSERWNLMAMLVHAGVIMS